MILFERNGGAAALDPAQPVMILKSYDHVTFDIFDTIVTRTVPTSHDVHSIVAKRLEGTANCRRFRRERLRAERIVALRHHGQCLYSIDEIYEELGRRYKWSQPTMKKARDIEINAELEVCIPFQPGVELLKHARKHGNFKAFVSDMYLPLDAIKSILIKAGCYVEDDLIYISCEAQMAKSDRRLFLKIAEQHNWQTSNWLHIGDNVLSDGTAPEAMGIKTHLMPAAHCSNRIKRLYRTGILRRADPDRMMLMGLAHHVQRIGAVREYSSKQQVIWNTSATFVAPQIIAFCRWILEQAAKDRVDEVWCLARDGQIVWKVLNQQRELFPKHDLKIRYIPASRQAFRFAALREINTDALKWILDDRHLLSFSVIQSRLGCSEEVSDLLKSMIGPDYEPTNEPLDELSLDAIEKGLRNPANAPIILGKSTEQRALLLEYLQRSGARSRFAVLDIGWHGSLQRSLASILKDSQFEQSHYPGYYFGLYSEGGKSDQCIMRGFNFGSAKNNDLEKRAVNVFELLFAADHPQVLRYARNETGEVVAAFNSAESWSAGMNWGIQVQQEAIIAYAQTLNLHSKAAATLNQKSSWQLLCEFVRNPSKIEAEVYSTWNVESLQGIKTYSSLGAKLTLPLVFDFAKNRHKTCHHWRPFVVASNPWYLNFLYRFFLKYRILR
jgi:FMN phosphatase YigB (HAD superfamily)